MGDWVSRSGEEGEEQEEIPEYGVGRLFSM